MKRSIFGSIILLLFVCTYQARACDCASSGPPCQAFWQTDAVFSATVISKSVITVDTGIESSPKQQQIAVKLLVEDTFRGALGGNDVEIVTGMGDPDCGYNFEKGKKYLVYASEYRGRLYAGICNRTRLLSEAAEDLTYFRNLPPENSGSSIRVKVVKRVPPMDENSRYAATSMAGVKIVADNGEQKYEGTTNSTGVYEFKNLPPGKYKVTSDIPQNERNHWKTEVTVTDRSCSSVEFWNILVAKISGTVFDENGSPANNVKIDLIELDDANTPTPAGRSRYTNGSGMYEIPDVPPGKYVLGINLIGAQSGQCPRTRTLYSNPNSTIAGYVEIKQGDDLKGYDLRLLPGGVERAIEGIVAWPNGKPAVRATVALANGTKPYYLVEQRGVDSQGRFVLRGFEGCQYRVYAWTYGGRISANSNETEEMRHAEPPTVILSKEPLPPLKLVLTSRGFIHEDDEKKTPPQ